MCCVPSSTHTLLDADDKKIHKLWDLPLYLFRKRNRQKGIIPISYSIHYRDTEERTRLRS